MNQNTILLIILGGNSEKYKGKPEILPNDSSSDLKKKKPQNPNNFFLCRKNTYSYKDKLLM